MNDESHNENLSFFQFLSQFLIHNFLNVKGKIFELKGKHAMQLEGEMIKRFSDIKWNPSIRTPEVMDREEYREKVEKLAKLLGGWSE